MTSPFRTLTQRLAVGVGAQVQEFLLQSFAAGTEGLMLKRLDQGATYQPSKRSESWIKIKRCATLALHLMLLIGHCPYSYMSRHDVFCDLCFHLLISYKIEFSTV